MYNKVKTPSKELRFEARESLRGIWKIGAVSTFTYLIVQFVLNLISSYLSIKFKANGIIDLLFTVAVLIIMSPITLGYMGVCMKISRRQETAPDDVFQGFAYTGKAVGLQILINIFVALWMLLFMLPGLFLVLYDTYNSFYASYTVDSSTPLIVLGFVLIFIGLIVGIIKSISYSMSYFTLLNNPNMSSGMAISVSKKIMRGNKSKYFCLMFSFIGWEILISILWCVLTFVFLGEADYRLIADYNVGTLVGIDGSLLAYSVVINIIIAVPLLFLQPYINVALAGLYNKIVEQTDLNDFTDNFGNTFNDAAENIGYTNYGNNENENNKNLDGIINQQLN